MNEYLVSPVTPIVIAVVAIAIAIFALTTVRSTKKKREKAAAEQRALDERVRQQIAAERQARAKKIRENLEKNKPKNRVVPIPGQPVTPESDVRSRANLTGKPRVQKFGTGRAGKTTFTPTSERRATSGGVSERRYDPSTDSLMNGMLIGGMIGADTPSRNDDSGSNHSDHSSSNDSGGHSSGGDSGGGSSSFDSPSGGGGDF